MTLEHLGTYKIKLIVINFGKLQDRKKLTFINQKSVKAGYFTDYINSSESETRPLFGYRYHLSY